MTVCTVIVWVICALFGFLMTPPWQPQPFTDHVAVETSDTAIAAKPTASNPTGTGTPIGTYEVRERMIDIPLTGTVTVQAMLREPVNAPGKRPAVLLIHGAGTGKTTEAYGDIGPQLASAGIVTLVPDKRLDNYTLLHRDYVGMAHDYETELDLLSTLPNVDATKLGVYAESEGTWISSVITAERQDLAFSIIASAPVYSGRQQMTMAASTYFAQTDVPSAITGDIPKLALMDYSLVRFDYADFNALDYYRHLTQPALVVYGTLDPSMPLEQGAQEIRSLASAGSGNNNVTLRYYPTNHQMRTGSALSQPGLPLDEHYTRDLASWINAVTAQDSVVSGTSAAGWATPLTAGAQPDQRFAIATAIPGGPLSLRSLTQIAVLMAGGVALLLGAALASIPLAACAGGRRSRSYDALPRSGFAPGIAQSLWLLGSGVIVALAITTAYVGAVVACALQLETNRLLFRGGWILLRMLSLLVAALWANLLLQLQDARHRGDGAAVQGGGYWTAFAMTLLGTVMVTGSLAFWGMYAIPLHI